MPLSEIQMEREIHPYLKRKGPEMEVQGTSHSQITGSGATAPFPPIQLQIERRKHPRYKTNGGVLLSLVGKERKYWKVLDVSRGGASFRYIPCGDLDSSNEIDIITQDLNFALEGIPFRVIADCEFADDSASFIRLRRCCVAFGALTDQQEALLAEFIKKIALSYFPIRCPESIRAQAKLCSLKAHHRSETATANLLEVE